MRLIIISATMIMFCFSIGCGAAEIGEACDTSGSVDECVEGAICCAEAGQQSCYKICTDQTECSATESCNGVAGSNIKSCQPKA